MVEGRRWMVEGREGIAIKAMNHGSPSILRLLSINIIRPTKRPAGYVIVIPLTVQQLTQPMAAKSLQV